VVPSCSLGHAFAPVFGLPAEIVKKQSAHLSYCPNFRGHLSEKREAAEMTLSTEREVRRAVDAITVNNHKEKARAKATIDSLRVDVRNGTERLSVAVQSCQTRDSSTGNTDARAELMPEAAERIVVIAAEANEAVRELNECIDKYEALKQTIESGE
jgi:hypothetical protein